MLTNEALWNAMKDSLGLPKYDLAVAEKINVMANEIQGMRDGTPKNRKVMELFRVMSAHEGTDWGALGMSYWYGNVLSGLPAHETNFVSNVDLGILELGVLGARNPKQLPDMLGGMARGTKKGVTRAWDIVVNGMVPGDIDKIIGGPSPIESTRFKQFNPWAYIFRALSAMDAFSRGTAQEAKFAVAANLAARSEGLTGKALRQRVFDLVHGTTAIREEAEAIADSEGLTGEWWKVSGQNIGARGLRIAEIVDAQRPVEMTESARKFGLRATFSQEPEYIMGAVSNAVDQATKEQPLLRPLAMFTRIIANVVNTQLDYSPVGFARAAIGKRNAELGRSEGVLGRFGQMSEDEAGQEVGRAVAGTLVLSSVLASQLLAMGDDEEDKNKTRVIIHGGGPRNQAKRSGLLSKGWVPYSVEVKEPGEDGKSDYYPFGYLPLGIGLSMVGNYMDSQRYEELSDADASSRLAMSAFGAVGVVMNSSFLTTTRQFMDISGSAGNKKGIGKFLATQASSMVPLVGLQRSIDDYWNPERYSASQVDTMIANSVPFARAYAGNMPDVDRFGRPILRHNPFSARFVTEDRNDPVDNFLQTRDIGVARIDDPLRIRGFARWPTEKEKYDYAVTRGKALYSMLQEQLPELESIPDNYIVGDIVADAVQAAGAIANGQIYEEAARTGTLELGPKVGRTWESVGKPKEKKQ